MQTHDLGNFFVHSIRLKPKTSYVHRAITHELEFPYRISNSWVFRVFGQHGFVLGYWKSGPGNETEALMDALQAERMEILDAEGHIKDEFERASRL